MGQAGSRDARPCWTSAPSLVRTLAPALAAEGTCRVVGRRQRGKSICLEKGSVVIQGGPARRGVPVRPRVPKAPVFDPALRFGGAAPALGEGTRGVAPLLMRPPSSR